MPVIPGLRSTNACEPALDRIQFLDSEKGWISGEELSPLPQNPFLLVTSDGGKTWKRRPIFNEEAESRFGAIQQF